MAVGPRLELLSPHQALSLAFRQLECDLSESSDGPRVLLACLLRRAASVMAPCSPAALINAVEIVSQHILPEYDGFRTDLYETLDCLVAGGDLLVRSPTGSQVEVYLTPPTFVARTSGTLLLCGGITDDGLPLDDDLMARVRHKGYQRLLHPFPGEQLVERLLDASFTETPLTAWIDAPTACECAEVVQRMGERLSQQGPTGELQGLTVLDPGTPARPYGRRWVEPGSVRGDCVARRPVPWGAPKWCIVRIGEAGPISLVDLPIRSSFRGCDEAWYLQAAMDAASGDPHTLWLREDATTTLISFDFPIPMWVERRLEIIGERSDPSAGHLLSYSIPSTEVAEEVDSLKTRLWLKPKVGE